MTGLAADFQNRLATMPVVAILRGITPDNIDSIVDTLVDTGIP
jgi:2-keto-3-deoxy-6-phosphogluconate aldolase